MGLFQRLAGVVNTFFQIGGPGGVGWNDVGATAVEAKDPTNTTFVVVRGAAPGAGTTNDLTTKAYVDTQSKPIHPTVQFDGNNALPANTVTEKFYIVTTTGANASIGELLWDNGSGVGTVTVIAAADGISVVTTAGFSGGTITLTADTMYVWDAAAAAWKSVAVSTPGAVQAIDFAIALLSVNSVTSFPAGAIILRADVTITTPYTAGTTIQVGQAGNPSLFQAAADNVPTVNNTYSAPQRTAAAAAAPVAVTIGGAPGAGAGFVTVQYSVPNP